VSVQYLGGGRTVDLGPSSAIHSRGRVPGGVMVSQALPPPLRVTEAQREAERERRRVSNERFKARHSDCECHYLYGNQPRPVDGWKPPGWR